MWWPIVLNKGHPILATVYVFVACLGPLFVEKIVVRGTPDLQYLSGSRGAPICQSRACSVFVPFLRLLVTVRSDVGSWQDIASVRFLEIVVLPNKALP